MDSKNPQNPARAASIGSDVGSIGVGGSSVGGVGIAVARSSSLEQQDDSHSVTTGGSGSASGGSVTRPPFSTQQPSPYPKHQPKQQQQQQVYGAPPHWTTTTPQKQSCLPSSLTSVGSGGAEMSSVMSPIRAPDFGNVGISGSGMSGGSGTSGGRCSPPANLSSDARAVVSSATPIRNPHLSPSPLSATASGVSNVSGISSAVPSINSFESSPRGSASGLTLSSQISLGQHSHSQQHFQIQQRNQELSQSQKQTDTSVLLGLEELERQQADAEKRRAEQAAVREVHQTIRTQNPFAATVESAYESAEPVKSACWPVECPKLEIASLTAAYDFVLCAASAASTTTATTTAAAVRAALPTTTGAAAERGATWTNPPKNSRRHQCSLPNPFAG